MSYPRQIFLENKFPISEEIYQNDLINTRMLHGKFRKDQDEDNILLVCSRTNLMISRSTIKTCTWQTTFYICAKISCNLLYIYFNSIFLTSKTHFKFLFLLTLKKQFHQTSNMVLFNLVTSGWITYKYLRIQC